MNSLNNLSGKINDMHKVICMHSDSIINDSDNDDINNSINTTPIGVSILTLIFFELIIMGLHLLLVYTIKITI